MASLSALNNGLLDVTIFLNKLEQEQQYKSHLQRWRLHYNTSDMFTHIIHPQLTVAYWWSGSAGVLSSPWTGHTRLGGNQTYKLHTERLWKWSRLRRQRWTLHHPLTHHHTPENVTKPCESSWFSFHQRRACVISSTRPRTLLYSG